MEELTSTETLHLKSIREDSQMILSRTLNHLNFHQDKNLSSLKLKEELLECMYSLLSLLTPQSPLYSKRMDQISLLLEAVVFGFWFQEAEEVLGQEISTLKETANIYRALLSKVQFLSSQTSYPEEQFPSSESTAQSPPISFQESSDGDDKL